jgi:hypothetical protein
MKLILNAFLFFSFLFGSDKSNAQSKELILEKSRAFLNTGDYNLTVKSLFCEYAGYLLRGDGVKYDSVNNISFKRKSLSRSFIIEERISGDTRSKVVMNPLKIKTIFENNDSIVRTNNLTEWDKLAWIEPFGYLMRKDSDYEMESDSSVNGIDYAVLKINVQELPDNYVVKLLLNRNDFSVFGIRKLGGTAAVSIDYFTEFSEYTKIDNLWFPGKIVRHIKSDKTMPTISIYNMRQIIVNPKDIEIGQFDL